LLLRPINEFNAYGIVPQRLQLLLQTLAIGDSAAVASVFTAAADRAGLTERGRRLLEQRAAFFAAMMQAAMATPERMAAFSHRLDRLERASYEALIEADERRRMARRELEQLRERTYQITKPDGRTVRVYRDGDVVRDESGAVISRDIIRAEDIPEAFPTWRDMQDKESAFREQERRHREIVEYRERLGRARNETADGGVTTRRADEIEADIEAMPEPVWVHLGERPAQEVSAESAVTQPGKVVLAPVPM
jgi:hypothetical protein